MLLKPRHKINGSTPGAGSLVEHSRNGVARQGTFDFSAISDGSSSKERRGLRWVVAREYLSANGFLFVLR